MAASKDEKKVMDVASPSEAKPETGSKPMVVGHKFMSSDPTIKQDSKDESSNESEETNAADDKPATVPKKIVLAPISDNLKKAEEESDDVGDDAVEESEAKEDKKESSEKKSEEKPEDKKTDKSDEVEKSETSEEAEEEPKKTAEEIASEEDVAKQEQEERLKEIVKSKKYFVPIKVQSASAVKTFTITFILVVLVGVIVIAGLIDAEVLDLGLDLPFDFL